ncbi:uncharacterized protein LOC133725936 [Rosa rugosa]|uniref:uncharacterized protein LOC133725936 n=1 Tax=Rosa rugosa TaxID=74645 RepID=UPI002B410D9D|nr:uncharacterized protein LOC133725936 [Rosa rugosa]
MPSGETSKKGAKRAKIHDKAAQTADVSVGQQRNDPMRESEGNLGCPPRMPTEAEPISTEGQATEKPKIPPRGKAKLLEIGKKKRKRPILVEFNERGQPIGKNAAIFSSFIGCTARELIPITSPTWKNLSDLFKTQIWEHITTSFTVDECYKKNVIRKMIKLWRDNRSNVMKEVEKQAELVGLQRAATLFKPNNVESMNEWLALVKNRTSPSFKEMCQKFKAMRAERTLLHRTSRKSFACLEEELRSQSETPDAITRSDVWIHAYEAKKKKDSDVVEDPEIVKQVKMYKAEQEPSEKCSLKDDAVAKVLGPDPRGRVRGLGFGAVPSKAGYQTNVGNKVAKLENALFTQSQNMLAQSQEIQQLKEIVGAILARTEKEGNNHGSTSGQHSGNQLSQQKDKENISVTVRNSETERPQSRHSKQKNSSVQHSVDEGLQSKEKEGARTKGIKNDHNRIELLNWFQMGEEVVASAKLESKDPSAVVHHVPLGHECWKVWVLDVFEDIALYRPTSEFGKLSMAQGSTIAWPIKYIKLV